MISEAVFIQNFLLIIFALGAIGALIILLRKTAAKKVSEPKEEIDSKLQTEQEIAAAGYKNIAQTAREHAKNLLYNTTIAAGEILSGTRQTNEHLEQQLDNVLQKIAASNIHTMKQTTGSFDKTYQQTLQSVQEQIHKAAMEMMQNTQNTYNEKLDTFAKELLKDGTSTQSLVDNKTAELLKTAEEEISEYKKQKLDQAADQISKLIQKVYRDILRVSIPENIQEELIVKSLEEAKKEGMFKL